MANLELIYEDWRYVYGYEGLYLISNKGVIKRLEKVRGNHHNTKALIKEKILRVQTDERGYQYIILTKNGEKKKLLLHRLMMFSFVGYSTLVVMHLNDNPSNNEFSNLRYGTYKENTQDAKTKGRLIDITRFSKKGAAAAAIAKSVPVIAIHKITGEEHAFSSIEEAKSKLRIKGDNICTVCKGKRKSAGGYFFKYKTA